MRRNGDDGNPLLGLIVVGGLAWGAWLLFEAWSSSNLTIFPQDPNEVARIALNTMGDVPATQQFFSLLRPIELIETIEPFFG